MAGGPFFDATNNQLTTDDGYQGPGLQVDPIEMPGKMAADDGSDDDDAATIDSDTGEFRFRSGFKAKVEELPRSGHVEQLHHGVTSEQPDEPTVDPPISSARDLQQVTTPLVDNTESEGSVASACSRDDEPLDAAITTSLLSSTDEASQSHSDVDSDNSTGSSGQGKLCRVWFGGKAVTFWSKKRGNTLVEDNSDGEDPEQPVLKRRRLSEPSNLSLDSLSAFSNDQDDGAAVDDDQEPSESQLCGSNEGLNVPVTPTVGLQHNICHAGGLPSPMLDDSREGGSNGIAARSHEAASTSPPSTLRRASTSAKSQVLTPSTAVVTASTPSPIIPPQPTVKQESTEDGPTCEHGRTNSCTTCAESASLMRDVTLALIGLDLPRVLDDLKDCIFAPLDTMAEKINTCEEHITDRVEHEDEPCRRFAKSWSDELLKIRAEVLEGVREDLKVEIRKQCLPIVAENISRLVARNPGLTGARDYY